MKILKATIAATMICMLMVSLTGCDALDYRDAIDLYNSGDYAQAAEIFAELGDFEDSTRLEKLSRYWIAVDTMQSGDYEAAIPLLEVMGSYEDCAERITECHYQLALQAFTAGDLSAAEASFRQLSDYREAPEYLRQITWQKFFDTIAETPLRLEKDEKSYALIADTDANQLVFYVGSQTDNGYTFHSDLTITVTRDSMIAHFTATDGFSMGFRDGAIGSEQIMSGRVDITTCTADTVPAIDTFEKTVHDNQGGTTTSEDPADSLMTEAMLQNFRDLMSVIPELITETGFELTLHDIGFAAM